MQRHHQPKMLFQRFGVIPIFSAELLSKKVMASLSPQPFIMYPFVISLYEEISLPIYDKGVNAFLSNLSPTSIHGKKFKALLLSMLMLSVISKN
jgi:hypothetical protein